LVGFLIVGNKGIEVSKILIKKIEKLISMNSTIIFVNIWKKQGMISHKFREKKIENSKIQFEKKMKNSKE
jgi:hypothetical protein